MKNYGDLGGCYPPRPTASTNNTLLDLHKILSLIHSLLIICLPIVYLSSHRPQLILEISATYRLVGYVLT